MKRVRRRHLVPLLLLFALFSLPARPAGNEGPEQMDFGVRAAKKGLWREALFRWEKARKLLPENPRLLNNLAVAYETSGNYEKAEELYSAALRQTDNRDIRQNYELFTAYYKELAARKEHEENREPPPPAPEPRQEPGENPPDAPPR